METVRSGKELCDGFFHDLLDDDGVDPSIAALLNELYTRGQLTKEAILQGLEALRREVEHGSES